jgi:adenine-specific DNA-methyltransferase
MDVLGKDSKKRLARSKKDYQNWSHEKLLHEYKELIKRKKFGLVWEDKPEEVAEQCKSSLPVLKDEKTKSFSTDKNGINHIFIEGDNYHSLSVLNYTHQKSIDVIYIDPPYNTGNRSWKYNNRYVDEEDSYRHSKWLSFMNKRLRLAKKLLKSDGIMCVMIDNYEFHSLRLLLEEIFPGKDIITTVIEYNFRGRAKSNFAMTHEYAIWIVPKDKDVITRKQEKADDIILNLKRTGSNSLRKDRPKMFYGIEVDKKKLQIISVTKPIKDGDPYIKSKNTNIEIVYPIDNSGIERRWYFGSQRVLDGIEKNLVWAKKTKNKINIYFRIPGKLKRRKSVWRGPEYDASSHGTILLTKIIGQHDFPFPKSVFAVKECLEAASDKKDDIILDFFAGSGTTGHAVLMMNKKDKGKRRFILCTNNEDNNESGTKIAADICYPRIRNVMQGYTTNGKKVSGLGGNLKYYSTDFVNNVKTDNDKRVFTSRCTEMLCLAEATFDEVANKKGLFAIYENQKQITGIIFDEDAITDFKKEAKKHKKPVVVYVFSYDHTYNEEDFEDLDNLKVVKPIPEVILNVYRKIYKELYKPRHL